METEDIEPDHPNPESGYEETSSPKGELFTYIDEFGEVQVRCCFFVRCCDTFFGLFFFEKELVFLQLVL